MNDRTAGLARRLARRLRTTLTGGRATTGPGGKDPVAGAGGRSGGPDSEPPVRLADVKARARAVAAEIDTVTLERDRLRAERLTVQEELGAQHGKRVQPRLRVEKTNGVASFVVGQRMMQRIHRRADDPAAGLDGLGAVFADPQQTARFARSHHVPVAEGDQPDDGSPVLVHAFKGTVGLVELHGPHGVRHLAPDGTDPGDIRPAATYDPSLPVPADLAQVCAWSETLSAAIPRPYVQLVWRDGAGLERIDLAPERVPVLTQEWDRRLGGLFDEAYARMLLQPFGAGGLDNRVPGGTFTYEERV